MWIQKYGDDIKRRVTLVLGKEKMQVEEETAFLASISMVLENMFYTCFTEANKKMVKLSDCNAEVFVEILAAMKEAKSNNISKEDTILEIISPRNFQTLSFYMMSDNLEVFAMYKMTLEEMDQYADIAEKTDNQGLKKALFYKSLALFPAFRKTQRFKKMKKDELANYMQHPYLDYTQEKEILEAVLWWLNYNFERREGFIEDVLSMVNFPKIKHNQIKAVCLFKMMRKSEHLAEIFNNFFEKSLDKMKGWLPNNIFPKSSAKIAADKLMKVGHRRRPLLLSVPFAFKTDDDLEAFKYGVAILNVATKKIQDVLFLPDGCSDTDFEFYNFNLYSFGSMSQKEEGENTLIKFSVKKCNVLTKEWKNVTDFGQYTLNTQDLKLLTKAAEWRMQALRDKEHTLELVEYNNPTKVTQMPGYNYEHHLLAYLLARQAKVKALIPEEPFVRFKGLEPALQRCGSKVFVSFIGIDEINLETESSRPIRYTLSMEGDTFFFKEGNTFCGAKIKSGMVLLNKHTLNTKNFKRTSLFCNHLERRLSKIDTLGQERKFVTPTTNGYFISEVGKTFTTFAKRVPSEKTGYYREAPKTRHVLVQFTREIRCQFLHENSVFFLLGENPRRPANTVQPKEYKLSPVDAFRATYDPRKSFLFFDLSGKISTFVASKLNKQINSCWVKDWAVKPLNPLWLQKTLRKTNSQADYFL